MEAEAAVATAVLPRNPLSQVDPVPSFGAYIDKRYLQELRRSVSIPPRYHSSSEIIHYGSLLCQLIGFIVGPDPASSYFPSASLLIPLSVFSEVRPASIGL